MTRTLLLVGHGSHLDPNSSRPIHTHAAQLRRSGAFDEVRVAFWKEEPSLSRALEACSGNDVTVVPVFISAGYFTEEVIPREMGLAGRVSQIDGRTVRYTAPIGGHPSLARVLAIRAREAGATARDGVAVLGHGTGRNANSERNVFAQAEALRATSEFAEVEAVFLDQEPSMHDVLDIMHTEQVFVVPLFIADGWHVGQTIPEDLALDGPETRRGDRLLRYAGAAGTHPAVADVITILACEAAQW